jgi:hypothetical protein
MRLPFCIVASFVAVMLLKEVQCLVSPITSASSSSTTPPPNRIRALKQVSSEPLAFTIDDFCDASTCAGLEQNSAEARLHFATLVAGELFAGQWGKHDGLRYNLSKSSDANNNNSRERQIVSPNVPNTKTTITTAGIGPCAEGLHVDTNNGSPFRSVTAILYLNDVPEECGAGTLFPLAGVKSTDPRFHASKRLLMDEMYHTRGSAPQLEDGSRKDGDGNTVRTFLTPTQEADAVLLESVVASTTNTATGEGLRIQPQAGRLLLFFSRMDDGEIDPRSWHGGERLIPVPSTASTSATSTSTSTTPAVVEKKIVTLFKEVSYGTTPEHPLSFFGDDTFEEYLSLQVSEQRRSLKALAESHAIFFDQ